MDIRLLAPIATCLAIVVSIYLWRLNSKKALSYSILRSAPLLNLKGAGRNELDVRFSGHSVVDAYLIVVRIFNSGHLAVNSSDYQSNLSIMLNPGAEILAASIIDTVPTDLKERIKTANGDQKSIIQNTTEDRILLTPVLLNEGDGITVQILARNTAGQIKVHGHIFGVKAINAWKEKRLLQKLLTEIGALVMAFAMLGVQPSDLVNYRLERVLPWILIFLLGFVFLQAGIYWPGNTEHKEPLSV